MLFTAAYQRVRLNIEVGLSKKFYGIYILQRTSLQKQSSTMELSFQNNASISLLTIFDKPEPPDPDDFWAEMYDRPVVKYGLTLFTISTLVLLTPYLYISLMFIHDKHFK